MEDQIADEEDFKHKSKLAENVIRRMIHKDRVLVVIDPADEPAQNKLQKHPNFDSNTIMQGKGF